MELFGPPVVILRYNMRLWISAAGTALLVVVLFTLITLGVIHPGPLGLSACPSASPTVSKSQLSGVGSAGGQELQTPATYVSSSPTPPVIVGGHVTVTRANANQTVTVPAGTIIDLVLVNGPWTMPNSSAGLTQTSAEQGCSGDVRASFRALRSGTISSELISRQAGFHFRVIILVKE